LHFSLENAAFHTESREIAISRSSTLVLYTRFKCISNKQANILPWRGCYQ